MFEESEQRLARPIKRVLADTGFAQVDDIAALGSRPDAPVGVYIHPPKDRTDVKPATLLREAKGTRTRAAVYHSIVFAGLAAALNARRDHEKEGTDRTVHYANLRGFALLRGLAI